MNRIKVYCSRLAAEMRQVWLPAISIFVLTVGTIYCGYTAETFHIWDLLMQIAMAFVWVVVVYSLGILVRKEQKKKSRKAGIYSAAGMITLEIYYIIEMLFICKYTGLTINL